MDIGKIIKLIGVLVAIVAGLMGGFNYSVVLVAVLGAVGGYFVEEDEILRFLVATLALGAVYGALGSIPAVGEYITAALGGMSSLFNAAAVTVIVMATVKKLMP